MNKYIVYINQEYVGSIHSKNAKQATKSALYALGIQQVNLVQVSLNGIVTSFGNVDVNKELVEYQRIG